MGWTLGGVRPLYPWRVTSAFTRTSGSWIGAARLEFSITHTSDECIPLASSEQEDAAAPILRVADGDLTVNECDLNAVAGSTVGTLVPCCT